VNITDKSCVVHKELWFYLMYHSRDIMKRNIPNAMKDVRIVSIYLVYYTETTVRMIDGIAGTTPLAVLALI
jgi:hypothetical protein